MPIPEAKTPEQGEQEKWATLLFISKNSDAGWQRGLRPGLLAAGLGPQVPPPPPHPILPPHAPLTLPMSFSVFLSTFHFLLSEENKMDFTKSCKKQKCQGAPQMQKPGPFSSALTRGQVMGGGVYL